MVEVFRIPVTTVSKIDRVRSIKDPYSAVCEYIDLIENFSLTEKGRPKRFDETTGLPKEFKWSPFEKFRQKDQSSNRFLFHNEISASVSKNEQTGQGFMVAKRVEVIHPEVLKYFKEKITHPSPCLINVPLSPYDISSTRSRPYIIQLDSIAMTDEDKELHYKHGIVVRAINRELTPKGLAVLVGS